MGTSNDPTPLVVVTTAELREIVVQAVREALDDANRDQEESLEWVNTAGAAKLLGVHPRTVTKSAKSGQLKHSRVGKLYRFRRADLIAYLEEHSR